jgi:heme-degrading monooxygenase HmoA
MLMRIVRTRAKPGKWPKFEREFFTQAPDTHGVRGLRGRWILHDLDDREAGFVVALWDSQADAVAFERAAERSGLLAHPGPGEFEFHMCEIRSAWVATNFGADSAKAADHEPSRNSAPSSVAVSGESLRTSQ